MSLQFGIPLFVVAAVLQSTLLPRLRVYGGQPDLVVLVVLGWAILDRKREGMVWAFVGGLFLDLLSGAPLGISSLVLAPIAYLVGLTEVQVYRTNVGLPLLLVAAGALGYHLLYLLALRLLAGYSVDWATGFWYVMVPSVLFDLILAIPVLRTLALWHRRLRPHQVKTLMPSGNL